MPINNGIRCDGFKDKGVDYSNPIMRKYVHTQYVVLTGEKEEEFIIDEKPVLVEEFDISKEIQRQAKGTDLKSLILQCTRTGDYSILESHPGVYADITGYPEDTLEAHNAIIKGEEIYKNLPEGLRGKTMEELANMSAEEIGNYVKGIVNKEVGSSDTQKTNNEISSQEEGGK